MPDAVLILNPVARRARNANLRARIAREFNGEIWETSAQIGAAELAQKAIESGAQIIVSGGGDGTLGEIADGILSIPRARKAVKLGVLPLGTGNDFARTLGVFDFDVALQTIQNQNVRAVDIGWIGTKNGVRIQRRVFLNVAGCGLDALVAQRMNLWRARPILGRAGGTGAYLLALGRELATLKAAKLTILADGETLETRALLAAIGNAQSYGGGMKICPNAQIDDGFLDLCWIENASRSEFLRALPSVFRGGHLENPKVKTLKARQIELRSEMPLPVLADGELVGQTPIKIHIQPRALQILAPLQKKG